MRPFRMLTALVTTAVLATACDTSPAGSGGATGTAAPAASTTASTTAASTTTARPTDNGVADRSGQEILELARSALIGAYSVHVAGTLAAGAGRSRLDIRYAGSSSSQGRLTIAGAVVEVRRIWPVAYVKAPPKLLSAIPGAADRLAGGKWLKRPATLRASGDITALFDLITVADTLLEPNGTVRKGKRGTVAGQAAIALGEPSDALWVATTGRPYPLLLEAASEGTRITFTEYGAEVEVSAPPTDQVVDVAELGG